MKWIISAAVLCASVNAFGSMGPTPVTRASQKQTLICQNGNGIQGDVRVDLDSSGYDPGSGYTEAVNGSIGYEYSSVSRMVCEGLILNLKFDITCVGLWAGTKEPMVMNVTTDSAGNTTAHWATEKAYGNKPMVTNCVVK